MSGISSMQASRREVDRRVHRRGLYVLQKVSYFRLENDIINIWLNDWSYPILILTSGIVKYFYFALINVTIHLFFLKEDLVHLSYTHTERQAAASVARSHWKALWWSKIGPRPIPKCQGECHHVHNTFHWDLAADAAARCSVWVYPKSAKSVFTFIFLWNFL